MVADRVMEKMMDFWTRHGSDRRSSLLSQVWSWVKVRSCRLNCVSIMAEGSLPVGDGPCRAVFDWRAFSAGITTSSKEDAKIALESLHIFHSAVLELS